MFMSLSGIYLVIVMDVKYIEYVTTKPAELTAYLETNPLGFVPFGALEWHGDHMVLGVDSIKATYLCRKCAEITGGVLFPCVNWGAFDTMNFPFTFNFKRSHLVKNTMKMMTHLYNMGFRIVVLLTGHYPPSQINSVYKAAQEFTKQHEDVFALGIPEQALVTDLGYVGDHAAEWETSIMMAINPEYVDLTRLTQNLNFSERCARHGVMGRDPLKHASVEKGMKAIHEIVTRLTAAIEEVKESKSNEAFNRIYEAYRNAMKEMYNIKHPLKFDKLFELQGIESKREVWKYIKWRVFKRSKQIPDFKS